MKLHTRNPKKDYPFNPTFVMLFLSIIFLKVNTNAEESPILSLDKGSFDLAEVYEFDELTIRAQKNPVNTPMPTVSQKLTELELKNINIINPEDAIKYLPNLVVRKRFIGDRNGVLSIRGSSVFQNARSLVFVDGVTLSNLIQNRWNGAPRWQIVAPEEIVSTEVLYGPYSAQYSGNAMNGVIHYHTRQPDEREVAVKTSYFVQDFEEYGTDDTFDGFKTFLSYGDKIGNLSFYAFYQHLENEAHPQDFISKVGPFDPGTGTGDVVTGAFNDRDPANRDRLILGAESFNETDQDLIKFKTAYDFTENLRLQVTVGYWNTEDEDTKIENYLRDENGQPVWDGNFEFNGKQFSTSSPDWRVSERDREDLLLGVTFEGEITDEWDFQGVFTWYDVLEDELRESGQNPNDPLFDGSGRVQEFGDTYWRTFDLKFGNDDLLGTETLGFYAGHHYSVYEYNIKRYDSSNYRAGLKDQGVNNDDGGNTDIHGLFAQVDWEFFEDWTATIGGRQEWWGGQDGHNDETPLRDRSESEFSPKFSLAFEPNEAWELRISLARAVRFPIVTEIFIDRPDDTSIVINNPELKPEDSFSKQFNIDYHIDKGLIRLTFFHNDEDDTIFNQRVQVIREGGAQTTVNSFVNIDEVRTQGVEFSINKEEFFLENLDLSFNSSYNDTEIRKNRVDPSIEGNEIPRVPEWRVNLLTTYHATDHWDLTIGMRYADSAFDDLANSEDNHDTYEGISSLFVWDFKTSYTFDNGIELAFGIDNFTVSSFFFTSSINFLCPRVYISERAENKKGMTDKC